CRAPARKPTSRWRACRRHRGGRGLILNLSLWFALHVLFGNVTATWYGPLQVWAPNLTTLNVEALVLAGLAAALLFGFQHGIASTLAITTMASLVWWFA